MSELETEAVENETIELELVESAEVIPSDYQERVERLMGMMEADSTVRDRMLAEIYIGFTEMDRAMRTMAMHGGPLKMLRAMMGGKNDG